MGGLRARDSMHSGRPTAVRTPEASRPPVRLDYNRHESALLVNPNGPHGARSWPQSPRYHRSLYLTPGSLPIGPSLNPMGQITVALQMPDQPPPARAQPARFRARPRYLDRRVLRRVRPDAGAVSHLPAWRLVTSGHLRLIARSPICFASWPDPIYQIYKRIMDIFHGRFMGHELSNSLEIC